MDDKQLMAFITPTLAHYQKGGWVFPKGAADAILKTIKGQKQASGAVGTLATLTAINRAVEEAGKRG